MTATGARMWAWLRTHLRLIFAAALVFALMVGLFSTTFRLYDERQARLATNEALTRAQCEGLNGSNSTIRFILDAGLRLRSPDNPISDGLRAAYTEAYRRLPLTDCITGAKTYFDPPFPS